MNQRIFVALAILALALTACVDDPTTRQANDPALDFLFGTAGGSTRTFAYGNYSEAFGSARTIMSQRFTVLDADQDTGIIRCAPQPITAGNDRIIGASPSRQVASMRIQGRGGQIEAICIIEQQRQTDEVLRNQPVVGDNYSGVPHQTPAQIDAATTSEQNDTWETVRTDTMLENQILNALRDALNAKSGEPVGG